MRLSPSMERFVLHWGEMGTRWGVNRSVAQIHALLFLAKHPLHAEEIGETLGIARSNVSTSIKELLSWRLVRSQGVLGDRRDHFLAETDCWTMLQRIVEGRKQREIDPTLSTMRACMLEAEGDGETPATARDRMRAMLEFLETLDGWYADMTRLPPSTITRLIRMGSAIVRALPGGARKERKRDD